jgi:Icc-related predicted phosphoesterase
MIIDCISDLHGFKPKLPGGDLLIVAGDLTARDTVIEHLGFSGWLCNQQYDKILLISGNHDGKMNHCKPFDQDNLSYLQDSGTTYKGIKIWGSPWTPSFCNWHFMKDRGEPIKQMWDLIPDDTEILITHGPPFGIRDEVKYSSKAQEGKFAGCQELRNAIDHRLKKLKLHVFGHVHEGYGLAIVRGVRHVNASIMNEDYKPVNKPFRIIL